MYFMNYYTVDLKSITMKPFVKRKLDHNDLNEWTWKLFTDHGQSATDPTLRIIDLNKKTQLLLTVCNSGSSGSGNIDERMMNVEGQIEVVKGPDLAHGPPIE